MNVTGPLGDTIKKYGLYIDILLVILVLIFSFGVRYVNIAAPGITWDEPIYVHAGITYINNILHLNFVDTAWSENSEHPDVSKFIYGAAVWLFNGGIYDYNAFIVSKIMSAIMGAATCAIVYLLCAEFYDRRIAISAAAILALIPDFVAHNQMAAIDGPLTLFFAVTLYLFMMAVKKDSIRYYIASAISLGVLIDTKFNGAFAIPVMIAFFIIHRYKNTDANKKIRELIHFKHNLPDILKKVDKYLPLKPAGYFFAIMLATIYVLWPWIWYDPLDLGRTLKHWIVSVPTEYFLGVNQAAPIYYYPVYFMVTTPALLLVPLALGIYSAARSKDAFKYILLLWMFVPFLYGFSSFVQGGMRYLLMIYPAVAILCALGLDWIAGIVCRHHIKLRDVTFVIFTAVTVMYLIYTLLTITPYYLDYYNGLVGGVSNVDDHRLFNVGWWGEGVYDSVMYVENNATNNSIIYAAEPNHMISIYGKNHTYIRAGGPEVYNVPDNASYIITSTFSDEYRDINFNQSDYQLVYDAKVQGASLSKVYKNVSA
jgi:hypothetical protein